MGFLDFIFSQKKTSKSNGKKKKGTSSKRPINKVAKKTTFNESDLFTDNNIDMDDDKNFQGMSKSPLEESVERRNPQRRNDLTILHTGNSNIPEEIGERRQPSEKELDFIKLFEGEVLTLSAIPISPEEKRRCAFLNNGWFLVDMDDVNSTFVTHVREILIRNGKRPKLELLVTRTEIRNVYSNAEKQFGVHSTGRTDINKSNQHYRNEYINLLQEAHEKKVTDIHIWVMHFSTIIKFRIDDEVERIREMDKEWGDRVLRAAFTMCSETDPYYQDGEYQGARINKIAQPDIPDGIQSIRLQFNPLPGVGRYLVCRLLPVGKKDDRRVNDLGYEAVQVKAINAMRRNSEGVTLVGGPTGSGKSTTLMIVLRTDMYENPGKTVITVEDPPEYIIEGAAQFAVTNANSSKAKGEAMTLALNAMLRSDPNIIMVGEVREIEAAKAVFKASMTGHRVYTTIHANHAGAIIGRLRDIGVPMHNLTDTSTMSGLIGQRLIRKMCPHCKIKLVDATEEQLVKSRCPPDVAESARKIAFSCDKIDNIYITNPDGCSHKGCRQGIIGREVIAETIHPDQKFLDFLKKDDMINALEYWKKELEGLTMREHALQKMVNGLVSPQDIVSLTGDIANFDIENRSGPVFGHLMTLGK